MVAHRPLVLCGPSGSGKSTLVKKLMEEYPNRFGFSTSHTTRKPRPGEEDGVHYHFTDRETMEKAILNGEFIENAIFSGNMYGTSKAAIQEVADQGLTVILDIDVQGVKQVKASSLDPFFVFIKPPSLDILKNRLLARGTETEESLAARLSFVKSELDYGTPDNFHLIVINDNLEHAYQQLRDFVAKEVLNKNEI